MIIIFFILIIVLICIMHALRPRRKTVWLLWLQGWDSAPWLALRVKESWERLNPGWDIRCVSESSLPVKIPYLTNVKSAQAKSDVIRLTLLDELGGVWADSSMLCMKPLDEWVADSLRPSGFWMYHGRDNCTGPASWFIVSEPHSYIIKQWRRKCDEFWAGKTGPPENYFWMDALFKELHDSDPEFAKQWSKVPFRCCEDPGEAHALAGKVMGRNPEILEAIRKAKPLALKLSHGGFDEKIKDSNGYKVIYNE